MKSQDHVRRSSLSLPLLATISIAAAVLGVAIIRQRPATNYDESKVGAYTLPNPLTFNDGREVRSAGEWVKRRSEILELFAANVYGHNPQSPGNLTYTVSDTENKALNGHAVRKQITIYFSSRKDGPKEDVLIYTPAGAAKPVPVILSLNFSGNQGVATDPAIKAATVWNSRTHEKQQAT